MNPPRILIVDDEPHVLDGIQRMLRSASEPWELHFATSVDQAIDELACSSIDVAVTDVRMPVRDGFELLTLIRGSEATGDLPVILLTGADECGLKRRALDLGATDLLTKPTDPEEFTARVRSARRLKSYQDELKTQKATLERVVQERTAELTQSRLEVIWRLGKAAEYRDEATGNHVVRVGCYCRVLAEALGLPRDEVEMIFLASPLHDIGKIGIPDHILLKSEGLRPDEWAVMRSHCQIGAKILRQDAKVMGAFLSWSAGGDRCPPTEPNPAIELAAAIALSHHERWDGLGYPTGLHGERIPIAARIVALADSFDALLSDRPNRAGFPEDTVLRTMHEGAGAHFDPDVYAAFLTALDDLRDIRAGMSDYVQPEWAAAS